MVSAPPLLSLPPAPESDVHTFGRLHVEIMIAILRTIMMTTALRERPSGMGVTLVGNNQWLPLSSVGQWEPRLHLHQDVGAKHRARRDHQAGIRESGHWLVHSYRVNSCSVAPRLVAAEAKSEMRQCMA